MGTIVSRKLFQTEAELPTEPKQQLGIVLGLQQEEFGDQLEARNSLLSVQ